MSIKENLNQIEKDIDQKARLIAVTKFRSNEEIEELLSLGVKDIAENKVNFLVDRREHFGDDINYHMIGRLQSNKVKYLVNWVHMIHSLDRDSLLKELEKQGEKNDFVFDCLIQLNISKEDSKTGIYVEDLDAFIEKIKDMKYVNIRGFMTMAPLTATDDELKEIFSQAKKIFELYKEIRYNNFNVEFLSMGMSNDYMIAIEEGSNMVRIGSNLFK